MVMKRPRIIHGHGPLIVPKTMPDGGEQCAELLESMVESARAGNMTWVIVVAGGPGDFGTAFAGQNAAQMNLGLDVAKADILARVKVR
jgi:hypothetical protein